MNINDLVGKQEEVEQKYHNYVGSLSSLREGISATKLTLEKSNKEHTSGLHKLEIQRQSIEVMKKLIGMMSEKGLGKLKELLSYGLKTIFDDRDYTIDIEISERGDVKTAEFILIEALGDGTIRRTGLKDSVGGGIQVIISLIIRIYFILLLDLRRFVLIDEALSQIHESYVQGLFNFLEETVKHLNFRYLFVCHDVRFMNYATRIYRVVGGKPIESKVNKN